MATWDKRTCSQKFLNMLKMDGDESRDCVSYFQSEKISSRTTTVLFLSKAIMRQTHHSVTGVLTPTRGKLEQNTSENFLIFGRNNIIWRKRNPY